MPITPRKERPFLPRINDGGLLGGLMKDVVTIEKLLTGS